MTRQEPSVSELPYRRIIRRIGAAGMALAMLLTVGACSSATGGGYIGEPADTGIVAFYNGDADFGFNFICEMDQTAKKAKISGEITYHDSAASSIALRGDTMPTQFPEIRIHGVVDPFFVDNVSSCDATGFSTSGFQGTYRSQDSTLSAVPGRFTVGVFDQGEPGRSRGEITGDGFSIELEGGPYPGYTRAGYIEGGNIQVYG